MCSLAVLAKHYRSEFEQKYAQLLMPQYLRALDKIIQCHTPQAGAILYHCDHCHHSTTFYPSCGHRHCPSCQHSANMDWLNQQQQKLLPVDYYLLTFTVPHQLRGFIFTHQKWAYQALFEASTATLKSFFKNEHQLGEQCGFTAVLHTHSRKLVFHPHIHVIVPNCSVNKQRSCCLQKKGKYLFNAINLATVFRGEFCKRLYAKGYHLPAATPQKWRADCEQVGKGQYALTYLARYLYRGVISEQNIVSVKNDNVTFKYKDSETKRYKTITEPACEFLWRVLQHVLPKGFRRARNYGFLHGNAWRVLRQLQYWLKVVLLPINEVEKKQVCCPLCEHAMTLYSMRFGTKIVFGPTI
jgi:hypothetical protein